MRCQLLLVAIPVLFALPHCKPTVPEPIADRGAGSNSAKAAAPPNAPGGPSAAAVANPPPATTSTVAPVTGPISLTRATAGLEGNGKLVADLDTDAGPLNCTLYPDRAPLAVANFVALARGAQPFLHPVSHQWVQSRAYDGVTFHRIIKGFMIQGGDPSGTGRGDPGYTFADEIWPGATHDRVGLLCMANRGPSTNGMQFFILDGPAKYLDGNYTIFGECGPEDVIHKLASVPTRGDSPTTAPVIKSVTIRRAP